jgi:protein ImuB
MALWLPHLPVDRLLRKGARPDTALVVAARTANALCIHALETRAQRLGLYAGQPVANAQAMVTGLTVVEADPAADARLLEAIADWCDRFTPFVALDAPQGLFLDITGAAHLFGGEKAMLALARKSIAAQGFAVSAAIAGSAAAARALSRHAQGTIAEPGTDAVCLAPLPVAALADEPATIHALRRAGLKSIGQVAARGRAELASRFGKNFVALLEATLGRHDPPISPRRLLPDYSVEQNFADPVTAETAIAAALETLAARLGAMLEQRGEGARLLEGFFFRADGKRQSIAVQLGAPTRDPHVMLRLFRERLAALADPLDPGFGFDLVRLDATLAQRARTHSLSFDADENARGEIAFLVDRLSARFGARRVLRLHPHDSHIPEAEAVALPAQQAQPSSWPGTADGSPRRPLRLLEFPEPIEAVAAVPDGPPLRFRWRGVLHDAAKAEGPERIAMEWWERRREPERQNKQKRLREPERQNGLTRDYFRVEDSQGRRFWLYRDGLYGRETVSPRWFLHGVFA